jgi:hypothetical protein
MLLLVRAWSFYIATGESTYAGHDGYDDDVAARYAYDSSVPNHGHVSVGDLIIIRDGTGSLGVAFIEEIGSRAGTKRRRRCPTCSTSQVEERVHLSPRYRCTRGHTFDDACITVDSVTSYRATYGHSFLSFNGLLADRLERLSLAGAKQNAIRELDFDEVLTALRRNGIFPSFSAPGR